MGSPTAKLVLRDAKVFGFETGVLPCELIQED